MYSSRLNSYLVNTMTTNLEDSHSDRTGTGGDWPRQGQLPSPFQGAKRETTTTQAKAVTSRNVTSTDSQHIGEYQDELSMRAPSNGSVDLCQSENIHINGEHDGGCR
jgi:hypothetical protein